MKEKPKYNGYINVAEETQKGELSPGPSARVKNKGKRKFNTDKLTIPVR